MENFYESVYQNDNPQGESHGWIQWKGTDVCVDLHCKCGHHGHYDGYSLYFFECPACHAKYALGQNVKLIPLTEEQAKNTSKPSMSDSKHANWKTTTRKSNN